MSKRSCFSCLLKTLIKGRTYIGEFGNNPGKRDGIGRSEKDNRKYIGEFKNDIISGRGIIVLSDGFMIVAEMNGSPNGYAIIKFPRKKNGLIDTLVRLNLGYQKGTECKSSLTEKFLEVFLKKEN